MTEKYRVRINVGHKEIEIESTDKNYVDSKLKELLSVDYHVITNGPFFTKDKGEPSKRKTNGKKKVKKVQNKESLELDVAAFVAKMKDSDICPKVEENIIDRKEMLPKIMMCTHFAKEFCIEPYLTTGQIEIITDQLGIKIAKTNVANKIRDNQKYFTGKSVRKRGQVVPYKLNRQGEKVFKKYLNGETL